MADTKIEWTDTTWNPVRGCTKVSPGCKHCYAETFAERWRGIPGHAYEQGFDLRLVPEKLDEPLHWRKPRRVFVNSMSDLFHEDVPVEYIHDVFATMGAARQHTFQILTKRADRMRDILTSAYFPEKFHLDYGPLQSRFWPLPNVWLGVSVENQEQADKRIPDLLAIPASVRFVSCEPLLGPVKLSRHFVSGCLPACGYHGDRLFHVGGQCRGGLQWVIVGGESGPGARPCDVEWIRSIVGQCKAAGVPCFVKQLGADPRPGEWGMKTNWGLHLKSRKGGDPAEWPEDLNVREFPR